VPGILAKVAKKDPSPPSKLTPDLPAVVDDIVARALAKDSGQRYATAHLMAEDIQDVLAGRAPRHRATWTPPLPADDTLRSSVSARTGAPERVAAGKPSRAEPPTADLRTAGAPDAPSPKRPHDDSLMLRLAERVGLRGVLVLIAVLAVGVAFPLALRRANETLPLPIPLPSIFTAGEPGHLEIDFEHPLRSGTLRIYVDDEQVLEEALSGKVTKKILNFRMRKGSTNQVLDVTPGEHVIRIDVDSSGYDGSRRIRGVFKSGETRRLEATVDGLIKKDLTLVWGS
jgi:hypothetical protein